MDGKKQVNVVHSCCYIFPPYLLRADEMNLAKNKQTWGHVSCYDGQSRYHLEVDSELRFDPVFTIAIAHDTRMEIALPTHFPRGSISV